VRGEREGRGVGFLLMAARSYWWDGMGMIVFGQGVVLIHSIGDGRWEGGRTRKNLDIR
jgi:hypothetical protein